MKIKSDSIKNQNRLTSKKSAMSSSNKENEIVILRNSKKPRLKRVKTEIESSSGSDEDKEDTSANQTFTDAIDKVDVKTDLKKCQDDTLQKSKVYA